MRSGARAWRRTRSGYDQRYDAMGAATLSWPPWRLAYALHFVEREGFYREDAWGAIDAL